MRKDLEMPDIKVGDPDRGGGWGGIWDLNPRMPESQSGALTASPMPPQEGPSYLDFFSCQLFAAMARLLRGLCRLPG